jgi:ABC-2 type transport system permease protein
MEVLISSVKPFQLMFGKIIGVGAVGLTQFSVWIALLFIGNLFLAPLLLLIGVDANGLSGAPSGMNSPVDQSEMQAMMMSLKDVHFGWIGIGVLIYFLLGFFLYGTMFAAVGAVGNDETNAQSLTLPIMLPIIIAFMMMITALNDPEGRVAFWGSIIPFTSPVIMPALLAYQPPFWQIGLSLLLLILMFILITYFAGKIYRIGVLMYGKKISFKEIFHWLIQ